VQKLQAFQRDGKCSLDENVAAMNIHRHAAEPAIIAENIAARCMQSIAHETSA